MVVRSHEHHLGRQADGNVQCPVAMHGFKMLVPTDLLYAATPLRVTLRLLLVEAAARSWDVEFFDVTEAFWYTPWPVASTRVEIAKLDWSGKRIV